MVKTSRKRLKVSLVPEIKKLGPVSVAPKLDEFPLFGGFFDFSPLDFPDLDNFWDLTKFWIFDFPDFLASSSPLPPLLTPNITTLLLLFPTLGLDTSGDLVIFSIEVNRAAILLKP